MLITTAVSLCRQHAVLQIAGDKLFMSNLGVTSAGGLTQQVAE